MFQEPLPWQQISTEVLVWLRQLTEEELSESSVLAQDLLRRGALALLFFASRAKRQKGEKDEKQACNALLCIRLLAQQLQVLANVTEGWETELQDLAVVLGHWVSTDWCSPRIEVVGYLPCCSTPGSFLLGHCSHNALKAVLDVVMCEPQIPSSLDVCRAYGGWRRSQIRTGTGRLACACLSLVSSLRITQVFESLLFKSSKFRVVCSFLARFCRFSCFPFLSRFCLLSSFF